MEGPFLLALLSVVLAGTSQAELSYIVVEKDQHTCQPMDATSICGAIGYHLVDLPNSRGQATQAEANAELATFFPLVQCQCSNALVHFLCSVYAPPCYVTDMPDVHIHLRPCRELCNHVRAGCRPELEEVGLKWPAHFNCSLYPRREDDPVCFGPPDVTAIIPPMLPRPTTSAAGAPVMNGSGLNLDGYRCKQCAAGFTGRLCETEMFECEGTRCLNGGECMEHIGGFTCTCRKGFEGERCEKETVHGGAVPTVLGRRLQGVVVTLSAVVLSAVVSTLQ